MAGSSGSVSLSELQTVLGAHEEDKPESPGSIAGTIADPSGASITGAVVELTRTGQTPRVQASSDEDGRFVFFEVAPGKFRLTISAQGFQTAEMSVTVRPGEHYLAPSITLSLTSHMTAITVTPQTLEQVAQTQIKAQETQRVLGFIPNFYVSYVPDAVPLTFKQKMELAWKTSVDPTTIGAVATFAGIEQQRNWYQSYGQGAAGYSKRFAASYAGVATGTFLGGAVFPALLKQDPRYYYKGTGSWRSRLWYALSRSVITRGDNGLPRPNYSDFLGDLAAAGIATSYRPEKNRNAEFVFQSAGIRVAETALANVFQEFLSRRLTPSVSRRHTVAP